MENVFIVYAVSLISERRRQKAFQSIDSSAQTFKTVLIYFAGQCLIYFSLRYYREASFRIVCNSRNYGKTNQLTERR